MRGLRVEDLGFRLLGFKTLHQFLVKSTRVCSEAKQTTKMITRALKAFAACNGGQGIPKSGIPFWGIRMGQG